MQKTVQDKRYFKGLPSPSAAALVATFIWTGDTKGLSGHAGMLALVVVFTVAAALLMVSNVRYNGSTTVPTSAGTYVITADCAASANYAAVTGASFGSFVIVAPVGTPIRTTDLLTLAGLLGLVGLIALRKTSAA